MKAREDWFSACLRTFICSVVVLTTQPLTVPNITPLDLCAYLLEPCTYAREDCLGRENCVPLDGTQGVCQCDRFFAFTGPHCNEPTGVTYALAPLIATPVVTSAFVIVVRSSGILFVPAHACSTFLC